MTPLNGYGTRQPTPFALSLSKSLPLASFLRKPAPTRAGRSTAPPFALSLSKGKRGNGYTQGRRLERCFWEVYTGNPRSSRARSTMFLKASRSAPVTTACSCASCSATG